MASRKNEAAWMEKDQRWRIYVQKDKVRKPFYSRTPGKKGKAECEKQADAWLAASDDPGSVRFGVLWSEYEKELEVTVGTSYYKQITGNGKLYILPLLRHKRVSSVVPQDWQDCINQAGKKGLALKTLKDIRGAMTHFCRYLRKRRIRIEPPEDITFPKDAPKPKKKILQPNDLQILFSVDTVAKYNKQVPAFYIHAWRLYVILGLRPGELCGLRTTDVVNGVMYIDKAINAELEETGGKNENATRVIYLPERAKAELEAQKAMLKKCGIISPWLFPMEDGSEPNPGHIYRTWKTYRKQHGLTHTSLYELRHTMVSIQADIPDALLKPIVGHSQRMDTRGVYGHVVDGNAKRVAKMIDASLDRLIKKEEVQ